MSSKKLIVITGPTASGKSALAVSLAKALDTDIISADSRQIYKGIPIVTAVPSIEERLGVTHHLMEILPLDAYYSAAKFQEDSDKLLSDLFNERDIAIVCGGSMLYLDALIHGIDELPTVPQALRNELMSMKDIYGDEWLKNKLKELDPDYYLKVDLRNLKRVFHAVEISLTAGKPYSKLLSGKSHQNAYLPKPYDIIKISLSGDRNLLFDRINLRVIQMIKSGLEEEAEKVYPLRHLNSLNTVGLKEMFAYFDGLLSREEAISRIQKNTRVYAKKQMTWHKRDNNIIYLDFMNSIGSNSQKVLNLLMNS